ncbi:2-acylglycerol O-acyltransferase 1 [Eurytemora carolleeae]|uniref:2-acylglycerol O-acyltransferase 1 n=1 Tax=Eurytemora carolleeae TaxID=1294199 RepID=UPI000C77E734|nr:2-acylglycerol O-acyltransferase 1 [Eurytemora carolleeae]|eukprot:XP_023340574.1 2-acylglycerol O-acyltransferase 1-like [Eurytemora affinis]
MIVDRKCQEQGGRSDWIKDWVRNWSLWRHYVNYFPIRLIKTVELDPSKNYIFGSHPHGLLASGTFGALATEGAGASKLFPGFKINVHTLGLNFWFPINREWILGLGGVSASRESISYLLRKPGGMVSVIVVGGAAESMFSSESQVSLVLNKRKGFIKIALQHGAQLVPTFSFGEAHVYNIMNTQEGTWIRNLQEKFRNIVGFAPVLFLGRGMFQYNFGLIPHRKPVNVVVGEPIPVEKTSNPTVEEIEDLHKQYVTALVQLYDKYNPVYGDTNISLNIV